VYADVISHPALALLQEHGIEVSYREMTDRIVNRRGDGLCPVETLCVDLTTIDDMVDAISNFINKLK
jgi:iron complex outermembrane receptor protein